MIAYFFTKHANRQLQKFPADVQKFIIEKIKFYISTGNPLHYADSIEGSQLFKKVLTHILKFSNITPHTGKNQVSIYT